MSQTTDTQQRILDSARELIYARSYADVGVADICDHAGVKKGSFYHFFPSKRDLTLAVLDAYSLAMKQQLVEQAFRADIPPLARLSRFSELAYEFQKKLMEETGRVLGCPFGNLATELATQDEAIRSKIDGIFSGLQAQFRQILQEAAKMDELDKKTDTDATAQAMLAYFEGVVMLAKTRNDPEIMRQLLPAMAQIRIPRQH